MFNTIIDKIKTFVRHNSGLVGGVVICAMLLVWSGCQVTTENPFNPGEKITVQELDAAVNLYVTKVSAAYDDIEKQEAIRAAILEAGLAYAGGGGIDPLGIASTLMGILGLGAIYDNRKKDAVIVSKTNALAALSSTKETA